MLITDVCIKINNIQNVKVIWLLVFGLECVQLGKKYSFEKIIINQRLLVYIITAFIMILTKFNKKLDFKINFPWKIRQNLGSAQKYA